MTHQGRGKYSLAAALALLPIIVAIRPNAISREDKVIGWSETYKIGGSAPATAAITVDHLSWSPRAFLYKNLLTLEECDHLVSISEHKMVKATVLNPDTGGQEPNKLRNNKETWLAIAQDSIVDKIEHRISRYTYLPLEHGEPFHVMQYLPGQGYDAHTDWLDDWWHPVLGNERIATIIIYLSDVAEGGETVFPNSTALPGAAAAQASACARQGVHVKPRKGDALMFYDLLETGRPDAASRHQGCPVVRGEKWTATKRILVNRRPQEEMNGTLKWIMEARQAMVNANEKPPIR